MKIDFKYIILFIIFFISCGRKVQEDIKFDKDIYTPVNSSNFNIKGIENKESSLITVFDPWQGAKNISSQLLIVRDSELPTDFSGQILKGDAKRIICMSSTHIAMLDALGAVDKIVGVSGKQYISNKFIQENDEKIADVGYEGFINYETIMAANPDLILLYAVNGASSMELKLKELGIPYLYIGDYLEETPLGKAEWVVPLAEVIGERELGIEKIKDVSTRYESLKEKVDTKNLSRPKVMLNAPFTDSWFMPSSQSYVATMIEDAGAEYIYKKNTGNSSLPIDIEEAYKLISEADYWINIGTVKSYKELLSSYSKFADTKCVKEGKVYNNNLRLSPGGGNDCYESGIMNPDLILRDLIKIFHPELITEDFTYYHKLE